MRNGEVDVLSDGEEDVKVRIESKRGREVAASFLDMMHHGLSKMGPLGHSRTKRHWAYIYRAHLLEYLYSFWQRLYWRIFCHVTL